MSELERESVGYMLLRRCRAGFATTSASLVLASCGGGGGDATPAGELRNGPAEFLRCEVPQQIAIVRENEGGSGWKTNRYLQFAGQPLAKVLPAAGLATAKNPEGVLSHGPLHAQNCTPGAGALQTVSFRVRTLGFHGRGIGDHLAFGLRFNYPTFNALGNERYEGIGVMLNQFFGGVTGERFGYPVGNELQLPATWPQVDLADDTIYLVEMQADTASASYRVTAEGSGQSTGWKNYAQPAGLPPLQGTGLLFALLCRDDNGRCEAFDAAFRVEIFDIVAGWR
jgi:hypothetical protein